jgi:DNA-binding MarR family transcriptional regulator
MSSARLNSKASTADVRQCAAEIIDVIPVVMNAVRTSMRNNIAEGLSIPQFRCLGYISRQPGSSVSDVAGFLGVTLATASAMIDRLVRAGYVLLETSLQDRRRAALNASAQGKALVDRIRSAARRDMAETLGAADESQLEALMDGLAALKKLFRRE